jgi:hypothetical protein
VTRRLPEGRGLRWGENAAAEQGESDALRRQLLPPPLWCISTIALNSQPANCALSTANATRWYYLGEFHNTFKPYAARIAITTAAALGIVKAALYTYSRTPVPTLFKIPSTEVSFPTDALGALELYLTEPSLNFNGPIFMGVTSSDTTVTVAGSTGNAGSNLNRQTAIRVVVANPNPANIPISLTSTSFTGPVAGIAYLSREALQVI